MPLMEMGKTVVGVTGYSSFGSGEGSRFRICFSLINFEMPL